MRLERASADGQIAEIAARQHGVVAFAQLIQAGVSQSGVQRRLANGRLHRIHRGVYAVGHSGLGNEGRWMGAVLACGDEAVLSHRSAAELWRLLEPSRGPVDVTLPTSSGRRQRRGLRLHRSPSLHPESTTVRRGIPVTTPARTLADLRGALDSRLLRHAIRQADYLGLSTDLGSDHTRSEAEAAFLRLCRRHGLPPPEVNQRIGRFTVDFLWRSKRLVVEVDGYRAHRGRQAFEDDRERELVLHAAGYRVRRFSAAQVFSEAEAVAASLGAFQSVSD